MEETGKEKRYSREPEANQIKKRDRRRKKGSLTVEASLVVPLCVMILTFLLSLTFYVYCDAGIRRQHVRYLFREVDMVCWKEEQDRKKQRKNGKQSVVKVDFREKVSQVRLQEIRRKYG